MASHIEEIMIDLPNIRCVTCGKVIGHLHDRMIQLRTKNYSNQEIFDELGLSRPCCRNSIIHPPKYSMVGIVDDEKGHPLNKNVEEKTSSSSEKSLNLRNRLLKIKEGQTQSQPKPTKKPMCYYAI